MVLGWRPVKLKPGRYPAIPTSLTTSEVIELKRLAWRSRVADIGTAYGYSSIAMALMGAEVVTADPHQWLVESERMARRNAKEYGVSDRIEFRVTSGQEAFADDEKFDGVFIDGDHGYEAVAKDIVLAECLVKEGGWLAFHDYGEDTCPGVKNALDERYGDVTPGPELIDTLYVLRPTV